MLIDREEELVAGALERIARARALGKANVKLTQAEIDALDRAERSNVQQQPRISAAPKALPASKKNTKSSEASKKQRSDSPKTKSAEGRARNRSNASTRSLRQEDDPVSYPVPPPFPPDYGYAGHPYPAYPMYPMYPPDPRFPPYQGSPLRPGASRTNSYQNMRQMGGPIYPPAPPTYYPQNQRYVSMPEGPYYRYPDPAMNRMRADSSHSSRSNSSVNVPMASYPIDQFPPTPSTHAPRFNAQDPRSGGSPARRAVSDPRGNPTPQRSRRPSDELFIPEHNDHDAASSSSRGRSDSDGSYHDQAVEVEVLEKPSAKGGYTVKTRSATGTGPTKSTGNNKTKSGAVKAVRRR